MSARLLFSMLAVMTLALGTANSSYSQATGEPYTIRAWDDVVKLGNGQEAVRHNVVLYAPASHTYTHEVFDSNRSLLESRVIDGDFTPSVAEKEIAKEIIRNDEQLGALANKTDVFVDGGYILHNGECAYTRCLQFEITDSNTIRMLRFVVVDLNAGQVLYRNYRPDLVD